MVSMCYYFFGGQLWFLWQSRWTFTILLCVALVTLSLEQCWLLGQIILRVTELDWGWSQVSGWCWASISAIMVVTWKCFSSFLKVIVWHWYSFLRLEFISKPRQAWRFPLGRLGGAFPRLSWVRNSSGYWFSLETQQRTSAFSVLAGLGLESLWNPGPCFPDWCQWWHLPFHFWPQLFASLFFNQSIHPKVYQVHKESDLDLIDCYFSSLIPPISALVFTVPLSSTC